MRRLHRRDVDVEYAAVLEMLFAQDAPRSRTYVAHVDLA